MKLVIVESPYRANTRYDIERNKAYARRALHDSLLRGEAPFASHLLYTQEGVLNDTNPDDRILGIKAGLEWAARADLTVVYADLGISNGMQLGIDDARKCGREVEYRRIGQQAAPQLELEEDDYDQEPT